MSINEIIICKALNEHSRTTGYESKIGMVTGFFLFKRDNLTNIYGMIGKSYF